MLKVQSKKSGTVAVFRLQGQLVNGETELLSNAVQHVPEVSAVILDLAGVTVVDARGLGVMLELRQEIQAKGIRFELMNVTKWVNKILQITRLDTVFQITSGVELFPAISRKQRAVVPVLASCA